MKTPFATLLGLLLVWAPTQLHAEEFLLRDFLATIQEADVDNVMKLMHPQLAERIDRPILEAWLQAVAFRLGRVEDIRPISTLNTANRYEESGEVIFTRGKAEAEIIQLNNRIVSFEIKSEQLINWFQRPTSLELYRSRGQEFLKSLLRGDTDAARKNLHESVARELRDQQLTEFRATIESRIGQQPDIEYRHSRLLILPDERLRQIDLTYDLTGSLGTLSVEINVRFQDMQGHLVGYRFLE